MIKLLIIFFGLIILYDLIWNPIKEHFNCTLPVKKMLGSECQRKQLNINKNKLKAADENSSKILKQMRVMVKKQKLNKSLIKKNKNDSVKLSKMSRGEEVDSSNACSKHPESC